MILIKQTASGQWSVINKNTHSKQCVYTRFVDARNKAISLLPTNASHEVLKINSSTYAVKKSEKLKGGVGDNLDVSVIPSKELEKGLKVESEHSIDPEIQLDIVKDHEFESIEMTGKPQYYKFLEKMENEMKSSK